MERPREGGEYKDAEQRLQRKKLPEVCGGYGSRRVYTGDGKLQALHL